MRVSGFWIVTALAGLALASCTASGDDDSGTPAAGTPVPTGGVGGSLTPGGMGGPPPVAGSVAPAGGMGGAAGSAGSMMAAGMGGMGGAAGSAGSMMTAGMGGMGGSAGSMAGMGGSAGSMAGSGGMMGTLGGPLKYTGTFTMGMMIPTANTCPMVMGDNKSPPLAWTGGPADTKSFAIVLYDTMYNMLHWVMWDIPPTVNMIAEGLPSGYDIATPMGAHQASNMGTDKHAYYGPCSGGGGFIPAGTYEYRLYALNKDKLGLMESTAATAAQTAVEGAMLEMTKWAGKPPD
jgi:Raf kinase inhibitor-like YbhB/YbcL family protein